MIEPMLAAEKMGIYPGSSSTSIFKGNTLAFGMLIPSLTFLEPVFDVFGSGKGGLRLRNVSYISDDRSLTKGICNTIPGFATVNSMVVADHRARRESQAPLPAAPRSARVGHTGSGVMHFGCWKR